MREITGSNVSCFRNMFRHSPFGMALVDPQGCLVDTNPAFQKMTGYSAEELRGMEIARITHADDIRVSSDILKEIYSGRRREALVEKRYLHKDGSVAYARVTHTAIEDADGETEATFAIIDDITQNHLAEQQRLAVTTEQRDSLVREVHHRIKNNLQGVIGLLRQYATQHSEVAEILQGAIQQVNSIALVHGLQRLGGDVSLHEMVRGICSGAANPQGSPEIVDDLQQTTLVPGGEAVPMALILNELICNAIKHGNSTVHVQLAHGPASDGIHLEISNNGKDLPADFDFGSGTGLGLGLRLVKSLLPGKAAQLDFQQEQGKVITRLTLRPPVIDRDRDAHQAS